MYSFTKNGYLWYNECIDKLEVTMRILGAGGCFDNRIYEVNQAAAWSLALLCFNEMGIAVKETDEAHFIIKGRLGEKNIQVAVEALDADSVQIFFDAQKDVLQVYSWTREDKEANKFYDIFEKKLTEYRAFILCPGCSAKVSSLAKFCPECGIALK